MAEGCKFSAEQLECIDSQFLREPLESLKREARIGKSYIEAINRICDGLWTAADDPNCSNENAIAVLAKLEQDVNTVLEQIPGDEKALQRCMARASFVDRVHRSSKSCVQWNQRRLPCLLVNFLLQEGLYMTAKKLSCRVQTEDICDWHVFIGAQEVFASLEKNDCTLALDWCLKNAARLKSRTMFLFRLHVEKFQALLNCDSAVGAMEYARSHFPPFADAHFLEMKSVLAMLILKSKNMDTSLRKKKWKELTDLFQRELLRIHHVSEVPLLELQVQAGLSSLKCPLSYEDTCTTEDPLHSEYLRALAADVPWAKHVRSKLVCAISKQAMNETCPPIVLPNGYVYGKESLLQRKDDDGIVTCMVTEQPFTFEECIPAYIM